MMFFLKRQPAPQPVSSQQPVVTISSVMRQLQNLTERLDHMSTEVQAIGPKIDTLVDLVHQLILKVGTPVVVSPEDSAALSSDGGKLDAAIAAASAVLTPPAPPAS